MPIRRSQKKRNAEPRQKQNHRRLVIDPMVNPGSSAHRHQARSKADPTRPHHRMVTLAQSSPGDRSACAPQCKTATVMLVFVRPGELRKAEWAEFNLTNGEWRIPAAKMKMRRPHRVPLAAQTLAILRELREVTGGSKYLFPSVRSWHRPIRMAPNPGRFGGELHAGGATTFGGEPHFGEDRLGPRGIGIQQHAMHHYGRYRPGYGFYDGYVDCNDWYNLHPDEPLPLSCG
jgi:hypothetical protein